MAKRSAGKKKARVSTRATGKTAARAAKKAAAKRAAPKKAARKAAVKARRSTKAGARSAKATKKTAKTAVKRSKRTTTRAASAPARKAAKKAASKAKGPRRTARPAPIGPAIPSSLGFERNASAASSGHRDLVEKVRVHTETGPAMTAGDLDANWEVAYSSGDEAPGGDNPTPDQDVVDDIGHALGIEYAANEELKGAAKLEERDRHRWELDPASAEDYPDHEG